jgi:predicted NBD/HSP70 family sugar kinase
VRPSRATGGQGSKSALVGDFNERVVLTTLRRFGPASKADLARLVGLTSNTAGVIVRKLEGSGLIRTLGKRYGGRGQPATMLELDPDGAFSIGLRVDRDGLETVLVDLGGTLLERRVLQGLPAPGAAVRQVASDVAYYKSMIGRDRHARIAGIGVGMPYNLGSWLTELGLPAEQFRPWDDFDLQAALAEQTDLPVVVENDGSAAAVGELLYGFGRSADDFLYVFIGPATGGGVVLAGDYVRGSRGNAGDLGVMPVGPSRLASAPPSPTGWTILMARASINALVRHARHRGLAVTSPDDLATLARGDGHPALTEWLEDAAQALVGPLLTSAQLLDLPTVVVDGDLPPALLERLLERTSEAMAAAVAESREAPVLVAGALGRDAGAVGAASLPLHKSFSPTRGVLTGEGTMAELEVVR